MKPIALDFLKLQIHFPYTFRSKLLIGLLLCAYLSFIIIVLEPFNTDQFTADYRLLLLSGYGVVVFLAFPVQSSIENIWYRKKQKVWRVSDEIVSAVVFLFFSGNLLYLYNTLVVNFKSLNIGSYKHFMFITVLSMVPVFVPAMLFLRQKFGERIVPLPERMMQLTGENKNEILTMERADLLFVKAVENYVEICFIGAGQKLYSKTFRQTLAGVSKQLPFLEKCHRSFLVNTDSILEIKGNSQSAKIVFAAGEKEIPLSKTHYRNIKSRVG